MDDTDYSAYIRSKENGSTLLNGGTNGLRYQGIDERRDEGIIPPEVMKNFAHGKYEMLWRDVPMQKGPLQIATYQLLLQREKPATIIELGACQGSSGAWMADVAKVFESKTHVYSVDIDLSLLHEKFKSHDDVTFLEGDLTKVEEVFPAELLEKLPHPWFVSDDAHVNVVEVMEYLLKFMKPGDIFCSEDTSPDGPAVSGMGNDKEFAPWGPVKLERLKLFLKRNADRVKVDTYYTDLFGYNGGLNWHGYVTVV